MPLPHARSARARRVASIALSCLVPSGYIGAEEASSADAHRHGHAGHAEMISATPPVPLSDAGQSTFAALAETVAALTADPETDWSRVDVDALREHLVSMDRLVLDAAVETDVLDDGYRFTVSGDGRTRQAIHEMVPAHAAVLAAETAWEVDAARTPEGGDADREERRSGRATTPRRARILRSDGNGRSPSASSLGARERSADARPVSPPTDKRAARQIHDIGHEPGPVPEAWPLGHVA